MIKSYVYFITDDHGHIKIGKANDVYTRMLELQTGNPYKLRMLLNVEMQCEKDAFSLEQSLHKKFSASRLEGEWFKENDVLDFLSETICIVGQFSFTGRGISLSKYKTR